MNLIAKEELPRLQVSENAPRFKISSILGHVLNTTFSDSVNGLYVD